MKKPIITEFIKISCNKGKKAVNAKVKIRAEDNLYKNLCLIIFAIKLKNAKINIIPKYTTFILF